MKRDRPSTLETLVDRVEERRAGPCRLLMLRTPVRRVISWRGSFTAYPDFAGGDDLLQGLTVRMLDKGTRRRDRFAIAEVLERRGAQLDFLSEALRVGFEGRVLTEDLSDVLAALAEQLREPLFDAAEFQKASGQYQAALQRSMESTGHQAAGALARRLYGVDHANYTAPPEERLERLGRLTVEDVRAYHTQHFGARDLLLVLVGDVDPDTAAEVVAGAFDGWPAHDAPSAFAQRANPAPPGRSMVHLSDKRNVDVRLGHALRVRRQDPAYIPLYLANYVLGGNFSARLMTQVRNKLGLTYGIGSALSGVTTDYEGHWQVAVTLSRENVDKGIEATLDEVRRFVEEGATEDELSEKKTTITGAFKVGLSTTGGLANVLHLNATRGFEVHYLDRFPEEIEAVTEAELQAAVRRHFKPEALHIALAGTPEELPESEAS